MEPADYQKQLRNVLNHLYDRDLLRHSPLVDVFKLHGRNDAAMALQELILRAIEDLKPVEGEAHFQEKRMIYDILMYRYIEQFKQVEVAHTIGVSIRQFRREQDQAIERLLYSLWDHYHLADALPQDSADDNFSKVSEARIGTQTAVEAAQEQALQSESWAWILDLRTDWITPIHGAIRNAVDLIRPVAEAKGVHIEVEAQASLPDLAVHPIAFRQILLNLTQEAIRCAENEISLCVEVRAPMILFLFQVSLPRSNAADYFPLLQPKEEMSNLLEIATQLIQISGGSLKIQSTKEYWKARLILPMIGGLPILVVDDNREIISLLARYASGTRYHMIGVDDPEKAIEIASLNHARIAVLDVMMPHMDGWELWSRFRSHPDTQHIPVIIMTILSQQELALALGARMLVLKPVKQEAFLSALDQVATELH